MAPAVVRLRGGRKSAADLQLAARVHRRGRRRRLCAELLLLKRAGRMPAVMDHQVLRVEQS